MTVNKGAVALSVLAVSFAPIFLFTLIGWWALMLAPVTTVLIATLSTPYNIKKEIE